ncbi:MAG: hypothetical protein HZB61_00625 [Nitrospirae bacterium]|nr:hypothetical protein [Nitrospirota bacterium]
MRTKISFVVLVLILTFGSSVFAAEEGSPTPVAGSASLTYSPKFITRRGFEFGNGSVQPSASVIIGPFSFNAWSGYNMKNWTREGRKSGEADIEVENKHSILETDWWATYTKSFDKLSATAGYFYEAYDTGNPSPQNTYEVFLVLHYDTFLQPGFEVYLDPDKGEGGQFYFVTISHSFALPHNMSLNLNAWANYNNHNPLYELPKSSPDHEDIRGFFNGQVAASLAIPVTKEISIVPRIGYSGPLSSKASDVLSNWNKSGDSHHVHGGITLVAAFGR